MPRIKVPKQLPDCNIMRELIRKCEKRDDTEFDFIGELIRFKQKVTGEIRFTNALFPEYTPHDEQYHVKNMFHIADSFLGSGLISEMNSGELFVLACSLYGHDWGMAVNEREKRYILEGKLSEDGDELWILDNEQNTVRHFLNELGFNIEANYLMNDEDQELWRGYVRYTHHIRSGVRVRRYFEKIGLGVAEAVARVCESHGLDCAVLSDPESFPPDFSVIREPVNLRAIAVYLRLIDLFDLGDDRTPFVIWNFVWPRNTKAIMEWEKHKALQPATFPEYLAGGRIIQIDGSTNDNEVYAALEDLKIYCDDQLRQCCDILSRMNDPRHQLNISHINWRVMARGFKPISIQFEFDRERMFEILGRDIYKGNPHIFLRELLQNSIDAIRVRKAAFLQRGIEPPTNIGLIQVTVEDKDSGESVVTWRDDGCGMDEDIIRKYLAVAGKSFYHSHEFQKTGINIEPISIFGIGILSCFIVADRITIETCKEPYLPPMGKPLKIDIPATNRQFRMQEIPEERAEVGTTVQVFVKRSKFDNKNINEKEEFNVTEYLCETAGFVEFPIAVNENGKKTLILNPYKEPEIVKKNIGKKCDDYELRQINLDYPWSEAVVANDIDIALATFKEEKLDLKKDLNLEDYEGVLEYPIPISYDLDFGVDRSELVILTGLKDELKEKSIRWLGKPNGTIFGVPSGSFFEKPQYLSSNRIYRDGIVVPKASFSNEDLITIETMGNPVPRLMIVNIPKSRTKMIDVARNEILEDSEEWAKPIFDMWIIKLAERYGDYFKGLEPLKRLLHMINFHIFHHVPFSRLSEIIPIDNWPIMFLEREGQISLKLLEEVRHSEILECPNPLHTVMATNIRRFLNQEKIEGLMKYWEGEPCLVHYATWSTRSERIILRGILEYFGWIIKNYYRFKGIRFLSAPWEGYPYLVQQIWEPIEGLGADETELTKDEIEKVIKNPKIVDTTKYRNSYINTTLGMYIRGSLDFIRIASFPPSCKEYFAYGNQFLNIEHPSVQSIIRLIGRCAIAKIEGRLDRVQEQNIAHGILNMFIEMPGGIRNRKYEDWTTIVNELALIANQAGIIDKTETKYLPPDESSFAPGSLAQFLSIKVKEKWDKPFGIML